MGLWNLKKFMLAQEANFISIGWHLLIKFLTMIFIKMFANTMIADLSPNQTNHNYFQCYGIFESLQAVNVLTKVNIALKLI